MTQVSLKRKPGDEASEAFFRHVQDRNRELYPTILSYLNAAVEMLEVSADTGRDYPILTQADLELIGLTMLDALRAYERKKKEEQMAP